MLSALVISPTTAIFVKIFQVFGPILAQHVELRLTHSQCYNEKVEVLASLGPQKIETFIFKAGNT